MNYRTFLAAAVLVGNVCITRAQEPVTVPTTRSVTAEYPPRTSASAPARVAISSEKLTDAAEIGRALALGPAPVIVMILPPAALARTDFASDASLAQLRPEIRQVQEGVLTQLPADHVRVGRRFENIAGFSAQVTAEGLRALQAHPRVVSIEPVHVMQPHLAQGLGLIRGTTYRSTYSGAGVAIAICDSGIDYNHPRLGGGGFPNAKVLGGYDFGDNDANPIPSGEAHGTACAGIAAGELGTVGDYIGGVAPAAKLYALKITSGPGGSATTADMVAAWDWCVTHKNDNPSFPIMVISTSFGGGRYFATCDTASASMTTAANNAVAAGITVLASSGNEGYCDSLAWPSCISSVISVGAVYDAGFGHYFPCIEGESCAPKISSPGCPTGFYADDTTAPDKVTSYANVASFLTLFAPGNQCYTLDITGSGGYGNGDYYDAFGGTSAACPYAAGAVASLQSAAKALTGSYLTPSQVKNRLTSLGDNVSDTKVAITKPRVNLERAIQSFGTNPVLNFASATLVGGNGNQSIDPNECSDLRVVIRNDGASTATNVTATISSATPGLTVVQGTSTYLNLPAGATRTNLIAFQLSTSPSFVCGATIELSLSITYGGGTNTHSFGLVSGATNYSVSASSGVIVPGTVDIGNHDDNTLTPVTLPFAYSFYGAVYSNVVVSSDGFLQFTGSANSSATCLPAAGMANAIFAFWDSLRTDGTEGVTQGIYTSTSGAAPNRIFNIEWRASYYHPGRKGAPVNFQVRLYEGSARFDVVYGVLNGNGSSATVGVQKNVSNFTQFQCNSGGLSNGLQLAYQIQCLDGGGCGLPVAGFVGGPTSGLAPLTVTFTNLSTDATSYAWIFGDGKTSATTDPINTYTNPGSYSVKLTAFNGAGSNSLTRTNYIVVSGAPPIANFEVSLTNGVVPLTVAFTNLSTGATNFSWNLGNGELSAVTHPTATYTNAGSYTVSLVAMGAGGTNVLTRTNYIVAITPAQMIVSPLHLDFGVLLPGGSADAAMTVSNAGMATLIGTAEVDAGPFAVMSGTEFSLQEFGVTNVILRFLPVTAGAFSNNVVFTGTGGSITNAVTGRAADAPVVVLPTADAESVSFSFETVSGLVYDVQFSESLSEPAWQTIQSVAGDGTLHTITNSILSLHGFYRLKLQ
jgi:PKD repeat protein/subtilisin family serine protease